MAALAALLLGGRYLLNPFFRVLALTRAREVMTAAALLVVLGAAALMEFAGLSMAMGAFLAGLMLADSAFRHELEADIEPFRSILFGLFFIAVGMAINVDNFLYSWSRIALAVAVVMLVKAIVLYALARLFRASHNDAVRIALLLPQAGEFAFVLFASASAVRALWPSETAFVAGIVTVTMALTPFSVMLGRYLIRQEADEAIEEDFEGAGGNVLVVGFGRFGQILAQVLLAKNVNATILDASAERVRAGRALRFPHLFRRRHAPRRAAGRRRRAGRHHLHLRRQAGRRQPHRRSRHARVPRAPRSSCAPGTAGTRWSCSPRASTTSCARPTNRRSPSAPRRCAASALPPTRRTRSSPRSAAATPSGSPCS